MHPGAEERDLSPRIIDRPRAPYYNAKVEQKLLGPLYNCKKDKNVFLGGITNLVTGCPWMASIEPKEERED